MEEQGQRGFCGGVEEHVRVRRTEVGGRSSEACVGPWDGGGEGAARLVIGQEPQGEGEGGGGGLRRPPPPRPGRLLNFLLCIFSCSYL